MTVLFPYAVDCTDIIPVEQLHMPVTSPTAQYGIGLFEGIRGYHGPDGLRIVALREHMQRMWNAIPLMPFPFAPALSMEDAVAMIVELCRACVDGPAYIRPYLYHEGDGTVMFVHEGPARFTVHVQRWTHYLPPGRAMRCTISPYRRVRTPLSQTKTAGNYALVAEAKAEARARGYDVTIMCDDNGYVAEGSSENLLLELDGELVEPEIKNAPILPGITRRLVREVIAPSLGVKVRSKRLRVKDLHAARGMLLLGTAAEATPAACLDGTTYLEAPTPLLAAIIEEYGKLTRGEAYTGHTTLVPTT